MVEATKDDLVNRGVIIIHNETNAAVVNPESTIIATGVARGGTSMLAQVLDRLGLFLGDIRDPVVVEDTEILGALQAADTAKLDTIIANRNQRFSKWGFKTPNLHNYLSSTDVQRFRYPRFIVVFRDPIAIAHRNELSMQDSTLRAIRSASEDMMKLSSRVSSLGSPTLLVSYEKALQNAEYVVEAICEFCGLSPSSEQKAAATAAIAPNGTTYIFSTQIMYMGRLDNINGSILRGWCCFRSSDQIVDVEVLANQSSIGVFPAKNYRGCLREGAKSYAKPRTRFP
jgi:hypothetical protein